MSLINKILSKVTIKKENLPEFRPAPLQISRFKAFRTIFSGKLNTMIFINILSLIFAVPLIIVLFSFYSENIINNAIIPYSANLGIGYFVSTDAAIIGKEMLYALSINSFLKLMPCILLVFIGFAGTFNVVKRFAFAEGQGVIKPFFIGIKNYFLPYFIISIAVAGSATLLLVNIAAYDIMVMQPALKVILLILNILLFILILTMAMFIMTQAVTFKLKLTALFKNSFFFAIALLSYNIIILILTALPFVIVFFTINVEFIGTLLLMFLIMAGLVYIALVWTVYAQWVYERYLVTAPETGKKRIETEEAKQAEKYEKKTEEENSNKTQKTEEIQTGAKTEENIAPETKKKKEKEETKKTYSAQKPDYQNKNSKSKASFTKYKKK